MAVVRLEYAKGPKVGGKAASLGEMLRLGVKVPPGFVVDSTEYDKVADKPRDKDGLVKRLYVKALTQNIAAAYTEMGEGKVAVRSSAVGEDGTALSFAGQHSTFLNVEGLDEVIDAVLKCWASLDNEQAIEYRKSNGIEKASMAVVVQRMVDAEASGVMFTVNPTVIDGYHMVIEAVWGLGETLVSGQLTPDQYLIHKKGQILETKTVLQEWELRDGASMSLIPDRQNAPKLTKEQILELAELGLQLELEYGWPQDIEWCLQGGDLYIVQSRPITTLGANGTVAEVTGTVIAKGMSASKGVASGVATKYSDCKVGDVLVTDITNPSYLPTMKKAVAVVTGKGGMTCHAAIVCRELGIPCVVGVGNITGLFGKNVIVNGDAGVVTEA